VLVTYVPAVVIVRMMLVDLVVLCIVVVLMLGHVHVAISVIVMGSIQHAVLILVAIMTVHVESLGDEWVRRRPGGRGSIGIERSSGAVGR
jgi:hypothetical protein